MRDSTAKRALVLAAIVPALVSAAYQRCPSCEDELSQISEELQFNFPSKDVNILGFQLNLTGKGCSNLQAPSVNLQLLNNTNGQGKLIDFQLGTAQAVCGLNYSFLDPYNLPFLPSGNGYLGINATLANVEFEVSVSFIPFDIEFVKCSTDISFAVNFPGPFAAGIQQVFNLTAPTLAEELSLAVCDEFEESGAVERLVKAALLSNQ